MDFIVLKGLGSCGKSSTFEILKNIFEKKHNQKCKVLNDELGINSSEKIYYFANIKNYKVCIIPPGDIVSEVQKTIEIILKEYNVNVFFVTDRTHRKNDEDILKNHKKDNKIVIVKSYIDWHEKEKQDSYIQKEMEENNKMMAKYLYEVFERKYI